MNKVEEIKLFKEKMEKKTKTPNRFKTTFKQFQEM